MTLTLEAPAKINLYLDVLGKRSDGYHDIKSIMQAVSLCDTVTVTTADTISVVCDDADVPTDEKNIAYKAAKLFFEKAGLNGGCRIEITKKIPVASGLAGGSTDAAAVLCALNSIFENKFANDELLSLGASLGADVPFCIKKGCALCEGTGEIMSDVGSKAQFDIVIARGGEGVSTPAAYRLLDEKFGKSLADEFGSIENVTNALKSGNTDELIKNAYNVFEEAVLPTHSCASLIKESMYGFGALFAMMSGSGPAVFGIFSSPADALSAEVKLREAGYKAFVCKTLS